MTDTLSSPRAQFGIRFSLLARRWRRALESQLAAAGLSDATWLPLVHLQQTGGDITQKQLAALVGIDGSSLVRLLDILCRQGLVERRVDASDARARLIYLTAAGIARVAQIRGELARVEAVLLADISDAGLTGMLEDFDKIDRRLQALSAQPQKEGAA